MAQSRPIDGIDAFLIIVQELAITGKTKGEDILSNK